MYECSNALIEFLDFPPKKSGGCIILYFPDWRFQDWCKRIRREGYGLDRQVNSIKREEANAAKTIRDAAKVGDKEVCRYWIVVVDQLSN